MRQPSRASAQAQTKDLLRAYLQRRAKAQQALIDEARVFSKRYNAAVDELEEIEDLIQQTVVL